jgi:SAM-dependent MidA family methyltransferase
MISRWRAEIRAGRRRSHGEGSKQSTLNAQHSTANSVAKFLSLDVRRWAFDFFWLNTELVQIIRRKIDNDGPQPFAWFMDQVLYHPDHGYYSSDHAAIGRRGDYFTNVSVGPLFGDLLAAQFAEIWERIGRIDNFTIVEQGAYHGEFASDVLKFLRQQSSEFFSATRYQIVEPAPRLQDRQSQTLREFGGRVQWRSSIDELEPFVGVHFSNELLDAMPINLRDKLVGLSGDQFVFVDSPAKQTTNESQLDWVENVASRLRRGFVLAIDYGFVASDFHEVLQVRSRHHSLGSPFEEIGDADITAHINWTVIADAAEKSGLSIAGFTDQHHFLTGIISVFPKIVTDEKSKRALQTLLHPEMLGRSFQVLALAKDIDFEPPLSGFKFARDARETLGL